jgi:hypothetical protein
MSNSTSTVPDWLIYLDLACVTIAGGLWYAFPGLGPWPLLVALLPRVLRAVLTGHRPNPTPFDVPLSLFVLTAGLGVWAAYDRQVAWSEFWLIVGAVLIFYALVNAEQIGRQRVWLLAFLGAGVALYFLITHDWSEYPAKIGALTGLGRALQAPLPELPVHRLHPNVAGGIMAMMIPFAGLVTLWSWKAVKRADAYQRWRPWLALGIGLGLLLLTLFGLLMTTSRGAWLALGGAVILVVLWQAAGWLSRSRPDRRLLVFVGSLALGLTIVLAVGLAWPGGPAEALKSVPGSAVAMGRLDFLRNTLPLMRDYLFVGAGLGGFMMLYSTYALLIHVGFEVHSHNMFLNVAVEQGFLALLILVWMWILFAWVVFRTMGRARIRPGTRALYAAALSLVAILIHGLVDDVLYGSRAVLLLFVPLAFAVPLWPSRRVAVSRSLSRSLPLGIVLLLLVALLGRNWVLSRVYSNLGAMHQSRAELSVYSWPEWPIQDEVRRQVNLSRPVAELERSLAFDPGNATANRRLGMIELALRRYEDALRHLEAAYAAEPGSNTARQLYGEALIANGRVDEGRTLWAEVSNEQNQLGIRAWWYGHIGDTERAEWMQESADGR